MPGSMDLNGVNPKIDLECQYWYRCSGCGGYARTVIKLKREKPGNFESNWNDCWNQSVVGSMSIHRCPARGFPCVSGLRNNGHGERCNV